MSGNIFEDSSILMSAAMGFSYDDEYDDDISDADEDDFLGSDEEFDDFMTMNFLMTSKMK